MANKSMGLKALEAVKIIERDGRKVYKIVMDGRKIELVLAPDTDAGPPKIDWA